MKLLFIILSFAIYLGCATEVTSPQDNLRPIYMSQAMEDTSPVDYELHEIDAAPGRSMKNKKKENNNNYNNNYTNNNKGNNGGNEGNEEPASSAVQDERKHIASCTPEDRWTDKCNTCFCSPNGVPACTKKDCTNAPPGPECRPGDNWAKDCNRCTCLNSKPVCTEKDCSTAPPPVKWPYVNDGCCNLSTTNLCSDRGGNCVPRNETCLGDSYFGTRYCDFNHLQSCKCCVPANCKMTHLCEALNGTCSATCKGKSVSGQEFCSGSKHCKCCLPEDTRDCPCGQDINGGCTGEVSPGKFTIGHCEKKCPKNTYLLKNHTCRNTGGENCKCCAGDQCAVVKIVSGNTDAGTVTGSLKITKYSSGILITGYVTGLTPGLHGFHVHTEGQLTNNCKDAAGHFNPFMKNHGSPDDAHRHVGDLGNILADDKGIARVGILDSLASLDPSSQAFIGGRGIVIHAGEDDLGRGGDEGSLKTGNAGGRVACGVIEVQENCTTLDPRCSGPCGIGGKCHIGNSCPKGEKEVGTCGVGIIRACRCCAPSDVKPGGCPLLPAPPPGPSSLNSTDPASGCQGDMECPGVQKCCAMGVCCARSCMTPCDPLEPWCIG